MKDLSPAAAELRDLLEQTCAEERVAASRVAHDIGVAQTTLSNFLRGEREPSKKTAAAIAKWIELTREVRRRKKSKPSGVARMPLHPGMPTMTAPDSEQRDWKERS